LPPATASVDIYTHHLATWPRSRLEAAIKRRVQTAYLGDGVILARILGRHKIFLRSSDRGFGCHVMLDGFWEMWLTQFLAAHVKPGMTVVDVGANFGYYTLLFADAVGGSGRVIAVEPNPDAAALLQETVLLNGYASRTRIVPHALSNVSGTARLYAPDGEPKNASIVEHPDLPGGRTYDVSTVALDKIALEHPRIDLVKIDAEGSEVAIIAGMQQLITRDRPMIVLEFNAARYPDPRAFLDTLLVRYGSCKEISLDGETRPVDLAVVTDPRWSEDRLLLFA
jgi:FkbM family methyltransferase